jgi:SAM-dependent methyltransferase
MAVSYIHFLSIRYIAATKSFNAIANSTRQTEAAIDDLFYRLIHTYALGGRLYNADLRQNDPGNGRRQVLDVGCGTGNWCMDMAKIHPDMDIYGVDLNPNYNPDIPNCTFMSKVDFTVANWGLRESSFDFIRASRLCGSVPNWDHLYQTIFR